jgi:benzoyl-CoA reductase/2-hydroxyglutaryl-CoA dehydratase subunit BcrC/BadD/HgdB
MRILYHIHKIYHKFTAAFNHSSTRLIQTQFNPFDSAVFKRPLLRFNKVSAACRRRDFSICPHDLIYCPYFYILCHVMSVIDFFGKTVNRNFRRRPRFTRGFLRLGYATLQRLLRKRRGDKRNPSQIFLEQMSMRAMRRPLADPRHSVLVNLFAPAELLHAMGLHPLCAEGFSGYLSGGKCERGYLDFASERGVPETYCSYHRTLLGAVFAGLLPKPRFIISSSSVCDANTNTFRTAVAHYGMDAFYIDVPHDETEASVKYVKDSLENLVLHLEAGMGRKMDRDALLKAVRNTNETVAYQRKFMDELARRSFPNYITAEMHRILAGHNLLGTDEALTFFRMQYEEILRSPLIGEAEYRADPVVADQQEEILRSPLIGESGHGERAPGRPQEKCAREKRILWCHVLPYYVEPLKEVFDFSDRYRLLVSDMNYDQLIPLDEDDIFGSMARRLIRNHFNGSAARRIQSVTEMSKQLGADGVIIFCQWGCKHSNSSAFMMRDALKAAGIKTLVLDGDAVDRRGTNEGQFATRLQAFLEILENADIVRCDHVQE